jgi:hypothetical protein
VTVYVLEAFAHGQMQMWGAYSTKGKLVDKAREMRRNIGPVFSQFHCNECEVDTGAISSVGFVLENSDEEHPQGWVPSHL